MVSSFAIHHRNEKTMRELLRIHPDERGAAGRSSIQLFGQDPEVMRSAAATVAERGADLIDLNMGCPVPKVCKTGAGAALHQGPRHRGRGRARRARGQRAAGHRQAALRPAAGRDRRLDLAHRLVDEAGVAAIGFHPRIAAVHHKGTPDYELAARARRELPLPVILSGGLSDADAVRDAYERTGAAAVMLARGVARQPVAVRAGCSATREGEPTRDEVLAELDWVHGPRRRAPRRRPRAARYLRKFYPWYVDAARTPPRRCSRPLQRTADAMRRGAGRVAGAACDGAWRRAA